MPRGYASRGIPFGICPNTIYMFGFRTTPHWFRGLGKGRTSIKFPKDPAECRRSRFDNYKYCVGPEKAGSRDLAPPFGTLDWSADAERARPPTTPRGR